MTVHLADPQTPALAAPGEPVRLLRRWVQDYFNRHDAQAARAFIDTGYSLSIGDSLFVGRDEQWLPAVDEQMRQYPGLSMTVHQVVAGADQVAVWFSEHGTSGGCGGRVAVWSGVALYRVHEGRLARCVAQEDYTTRARQLRSGVADAVEPPAAAPWDTQALPPNPAAEDCVRHWLAQDWPATPDGVRCDDEDITGERLRFRVESVDVVEMFSSGADVAFHARQRGRYLGGLRGVAARDRAEALLVNGIVRVAEGRVQCGRVIRDRGGLRSRLSRG